MAEQLIGKRFTFAAKASETRRLYGSINTQMIAEVVSKDIGVTVEAKQIESQPLRMIGTHKVAVRLTVDLIPEIEVIVHREGESIESALEEEEKEAIRAEEALADFLEKEAAAADSPEPQPTAEYDIFDNLDDVVVVGTDDQTAEVESSDEDEAEVDAEEAE